MARPRLGPEPGVVPMIYPALDAFWIPGAAGQEFTDVPQLDGTIRRFFRAADLRYEPATNLWIRRTPMAAAPVIPPTTPPADPMLQRQQSIPLSLPRAVGIVGCGGVGMWLAYFLALAGVPELWLWDHDVVSEHNLNRLPLTPESVGEHKSTALAKLIMAHRPNAKVLALRTFDRESVEPLSPEDSLAWLVVSTDTLKSRQNVRDLARQWSVAYIEAAAEGDIGSIAGAPADWATPAEEAPGYASVPVWVGPCVMAASMAASYVLHGEWPSPNLATRMGWQGGGLSFWTWTPPPPVVERMVLDDWLIPIRPAAPGAAPDDGVAGTMGAPPPDGALPPGTVAHVGEGADPTQPRVVHLTTDFEDAAVNVEVEPEEEEFTDEYNEEDAPQPDDGMTPNQ